MTADHNPASRLILASASRARTALLGNAGLEFEVMPAHIDEDAVKIAFQQHGKTEPAPLAEELARRKAEFISVQHPDALVIGADQVLEFAGTIVSKPVSAEAAREQLKQMRGKTHHLISAISLWRDGRELWTYSEPTNMIMRPFSDDFLDDYIRRAGPDICQSVGAYQLESAGIQLFDRVEGDFFTILGLPLLPLLDQLRQQRHLAS